MNKAKELFDRGKLTEAISQQTEEVRSRPSDVTARTFLFELLSLAGEFDRADKQLDVVGHQSTQMEMAVSVYREALSAEKKRRAIFADGGTPSFLTTPPDYAPLYLEALARHRRDPAKTRAILEKALQIVGPLKGEANGHPFEDFGDADAFLGPFLELIVNEKYAWLPFEQIRRIVISKPVQLRDLIWAQAKLEARGGDLGQVLLPVLYPGTCDSPSENLKLGRVTDWLDVGEGLARGCGPRLFLVDGAEVPMLEIAEISFEHASSAVAT